MKFPIGTADNGEVRRLARSGVPAGVTTRPDPVARVGGEPLTTIVEICGMVHGPVSAGVIAMDHHPLTEAGSHRFVANRMAAGQRILDT